MYCPAWQPGKVEYKYNDFGNSTKAARGLGLIVGQGGLIEPSLRAPSDMIAFGESCGFRGRNWWIAGFGWPECIGHYRPLSSRFSAAFCDGHVESSNPALIPMSNTGFFKPSETLARRWFRDNQPHPETWPNP